MPDFDAPSRYLRDNYEREDWLAVVLIYRNPASVRQEFATAERLPLLNTKLTSALRMQLVQTCTSPSTV